MCCWTKDRVRTTTVSRMPKQIHTREAIVLRQCTLPHCCLLWFDQVCFFTVVVVVHVLGKAPRPCDMVATKHIFRLGQVYLGVIIVNTNVIALVQAKAIVICYCLISTKTPVRHTL